MIFKKYANMKYKYGNRYFWCRGYYAITVGRNKKSIQEYVRNQLQGENTDDELSTKEHVDPFTGQPVNEGKYREASWGADRESRAVGRLFDGPIDSAEDMPQEGLYKSSARSMVMIVTVVSACEMKINLTDYWCIPHSMVIVLWLCSGFGLRLLLRIKLRLKSKPIVQRLEFWGFPHR